MSKRFDTILRSIKLRATLQRFASVLIAAPLGLLCSMLLAFLLAGSPFDILAPADPVEKVLQNEVQLRRELDEARAKLREIEEALREVREYELRPSSSNNVAGLGGAPEKKSETLDDILFRLQNIRVRESLKDAVSLTRQTPIGFPAEGELTSGFGWRSSPFSGRAQLHGGIDIASQYRSPVTATADGVVREAGWRSGYGLSIVVDHGGGFETLYAHLAKVQVKVGHRIRRGERIGLLGSSGNSTGPHLHYEIRKNGISQNPEPFLLLANNLKQRFAISRS